MLNINNCFSKVMGKFYQQITNNWKEDEFTKKEEVTEVDDDEWDD